MSISHHFKSACIHFTQIKTTFLEGESPAVSKQRENPCANFDFHCFIDI